MTPLRHVHLFLKAGVTIERNDTAETMLFSVLDFFFTLATLTLWVNRFIRLRWAVDRCRSRVARYLDGWLDDLGMIWRVLVGETGWAVGTG